MSSIDSRVVQLKFDNGGFEAAVRTTLSSLDKLKQSLDMTGAKKSFDSINQAVDNNKLGTMGTVIEGINGKFLALAAVGVTALVNITNAAVSAGVQIAKSLTIDPIKTGLEEYELNLKSIQTILANTQAAGTTLDDVTASLDELNEYSDKTIYNFAEMARNIGTFTAAGVGLDQATASIKGIANLAAMSGSNAQQAATAMYQLSQAISAGRVTLADWNSVVNAGMGGTVFQRALAQTAVAMGKLDEGALKLTGDMKNVTIAGESFRESISGVGGGESWLTSDVLTATLSQFTGDLTKAELAAMGFKDAQIEAIQAQAKTAQEAATQVKTLSQVLEVAKETATSGWAKTWRVIFGDYSEAKSTFTDLSNTVNDFINGFSDARNALLEGWAALGGRDVAIEGIVEAFRVLGDIIGPIKDAFRDIFPAQTAQGLYDITVAFRDFFASIQISDETANLLRRTFAGLFAIMNIGKQIIAGVIAGFGKLFGGVVESSDGILEITARIGDFLVGLNDVIEQSGFIKSFFENLGTILSAPLRLLSAIGEVLSAIFDNASGLDVAGEAAQRLNERLSPLKGLLDTLSEVWGRFADAMLGSGTVFGKVLGKVYEIFSGLFDTINDAISSGDYSAVLDTINTGLLAAIALLIRKFVTGGLRLDFGNGLLDNISQSFEALTGTLQAMETQIKAKSLLMIAGAVALLTASVVALSLIDTKKLTVALTGLGAIFTELMLAMLVLTKMAGAGGFVKLPFIAASLILLSAAILVLTVAVAGLSAIPWDRLKTGLLGLALMMAIIVPSAYALSKISPNLILAAVGLNLLGVALNLLASAVMLFATMDLAELGKGLLGAAGALGVVAGAMRLMPKGMIAQGVALMLIATSLNVMAMAVKSFATMDLASMAKGLGGIAGALLIIAGAMKLMPKSMVAQSAALILIGASLLVIGKAVAMMGAMDVGSIAKGLGTLAAALIILAIGVKAMSGSLSGAAALLVVAAALRIFVPVLQTLGGMSIGDIIKGLVALAAAFAVIGVAAYLLTPVVPAMLALGVTVALLGAGLALAGVGVLAFVTAFTALIAVASVGVVAITAAFATLTASIPAMMMFLQNLLVGFAGVIVAVAPAWTKAIAAVLVSLLNAIEKIVPKMLKTLGVLLDAMLKFLVAYVPKLVDAGLKIINGFLRGVADNIGEVYETGVKVITEFMKAISKAVPDLVDAGMKAVIDLVNGIADAIDENSAALGEAGGRLAAAIIRGMVVGISSGASTVVQSAVDMAASALDAVKERLGIASPSKEFEKIGKYVNQGFAKGLIGGYDQVNSAFDTLRSALRNEISTTKSEIDRLESAIDEAQKDGNKKRVAKLKEALAEVKDLNSKSIAANKELTKQMKEYRSELSGLGKQYDETIKQLDEANRKLDEAKKARDDFASQTTGNYDDLPDITEETSLDTYFDDIRKNTEANRKFKATLDQLRNLGLDETSYRKFLELGVETQPFLDDLLASGGATIAELNRIDADLIASANAIGTTAATELYQTGVNMAQGIVDGLEASKTDLEGAMAKISDAIVKAIKKKLGIKSPSRVFAEVGMFANQGLAKGLEKYSKYAEDSATDVGKRSVDALKKSMANLGSLDAEMDVNPVIAPVLDLDEFRRNANKMTEILNPGAVTPRVSAVDAGYISQLSAALAAARDEKTAVGGTSIEYNQYNTSPKALSSAEIYRQTRNQLSLVKGALPV